MTRSSRAKRADAHLAIERLSFDGDDPLFGRERTPLAARRAEHPGERLALSTTRRRQATEIATLADGRARLGTRRTRPAPRSLRASGEFVRVARDFVRAVIDSVHFVTEQGAIAIDFPVDGCDFVPFESDVALVVVRRLNYATRSIGASMRSISFARPSPSQPRHSRPRAHRSLFASVRFVSFQENSKSPPRRSQDAGDRSTRRSRPLRAGPVGEPLDRLERRSPSACRRSMRLAGHPPSRRSRWCRPCG